MWKLIATRIEPYAQSWMTERILAFHDALIARGQVDSPRSVEGTTVDCKVDSDLCANPPRRQGECAGLR